MAFDLPRQPRSLRFAGGGGGDESPSQARERPEPKSILGQPRPKRGPAGAPTAGARGPRDLYAVEGAPPRSTLGPMATPSGATTLSPPPPRQLLATPVPGSSAFDAPTPIASVAVAAPASIAFPSVPPTSLAPTSALPKPARDPRLPPVPANIVIATPPEGVDEEIATLAMAREEDFLPGAKSRGRLDAPVDVLVRPIPNFRAANVPPPPTVNAMANPRVNASTGATVLVPRPRRRRPHLALWLALAILGGAASYFATPAAVAQVVPAFAAR